MPVSVPKTLYIAGPYTAPSLDQIQANIDAARALGREVAKLGVMPFIPHTNTDASFLDIQDAQFWYAGTLRMLEAAEGVLMMETWLQSPGARAERRRAEQMGKPVFLADDPQWRRFVGLWGKMP